MKIWRMFTLVLWSLFLAGLLAVSTAYLLAYQTVLNKQALTERMTQETFVKSFREQVLIPRAHAIVATEAAPSALVSDEVIKTALDKAFSTEKTREIITQSLPAMHAWLDKKSPDIAISVPISGELKTFRDSINDQVGAKLKALPDCQYYDVAPEVVTRLECLPLYLSAGNVVDETMTAVYNALAQAPSEINAETLGLTAKQMGVAYNAPDYLSYLWALSLITTPLAALTIIYLILRRRGAGLLAVGITVAILALALLAGSLAASSWQIAGDSLTTSLTRVATSLIAERMRFWGLIGGGSGVVMIALAVVWLRASKKRKQSQSHYVVERAEE